MLKKRIIPTLLWKGHGLVKGIGFDSWRRTGSVLPAIKVFNARDVDELILLDIEASVENKNISLDEVAEFAEHCSVPLTLGGGISSIATIQELLLAGADKVCINTAAYANPKLVAEAAHRFGSQCIVAAIDAKKMPDGNYRCFSHSGRTLTIQSPETWAKQLEKLGAGEILLTSIDRDGTMSGYDLELTGMVRHAISIPIIASGGAGHYEHMRQVIQDCGISAVAAASMFQFTEQTPAGAKMALASHGIPVRTLFVAASD